jgi:hypothetical protein
VDEDLAAGLDELLRLDPVFAPVLELLLPEVAKLRSAANRPARAPGIVDDDLRIGELERCVEVAA